MHKINYVLTVVMDPTTGFVVGITKKKGPAFLINKLTFPGGKIEEGESVAVAGSREMLEETGIVIPASDWCQVSKVYRENYSLTVLAAESSKVLHARQLEEEPVWHLAIERHLGYAKVQPDQYVPDFIETLEGALEAISNFHEGTQYFFD